MLGGGGWTIGLHYLDAQPHPEVEENQEAERKDEEKEGGQLVEWIVLIFP